MNTHSFTCLQLNLDLCVLTFVLVVLLLCDSALQIPKPLLERFHVLSSMFFLQNKTAPPHTACFNHPTQRFLLDPTVTILKPLIFIFAKLSQALVIFAKLVISNLWRVFLQSRAHLSFYAFLTRLARNLADA